MQEHGLPPHLGILQSNGTIRAGRKLQERHVWRRNAAMVEDNLPSSVLPLEHVGGADAACGPARPHHFQTCHEGLNMCKSSRLRVQDFGRLTHADHLVNDAHLRRSDTCHCEFNHSAAHFLPIHLPSTLGTADLTC